MTIIWVLVLTVCMNTACDEYVLDTLDSLEDCTESFVDHAKNVTLMDDRNLYILACEKTTLHKGV